jgi:phage terminase large subunit-like protein
LFLEALERKYAGTRFGRQEIEAEILEDVQGALWSRLDALRVKVADLPRKSGPFRLTSSDLSNPVSSD